MPPSKDNRFDTSAWSAFKADDKGESAAAPSSSSSSVASGSAKDVSDDGSVSDDQEEEGSDEEDNGDEDDDGGDDDDENEASDEGNTPARPIVQPLTPSELASFQAAERKKGIVYISHIPHGMTVPKVRHLLSGFGDVERIYLQDGRKGPDAKGKGEELSNRARKRSAHFTEGWVEYSSKKAAKAVAGLLNAQPIAAAMGGFGGGGGGGRKGGNAKNGRRWRDEVWTMKYLPGFKWTMLSEQLANERASHASRLRAELSQSAFEQKDYLRKVERARVMREKEEKRKKRLAKEGGGAEADAPTSTSMTTEEATIMPPPGGLVRTYRQREALYKDVRDQRNEAGKREREGEGKSNTEHKKRKGASTDEGDGEGVRALRGVLGKIF